MATELWLSRAVFALNSGFKLNYINSNTAFVTNERKLEKKKKI